MEKDGKLVYIPNVMAGVTIAGINTAACLLLTAVLFLLEKGETGRIAGLAVFGGLCLFGWLLFGGLYVLCFRKTVWEFSGDGFRKKRAGKTVFSAGWEDVLSAKYSEFLWYMPFSWGPDTAELIFECRVDGRRGRARINLFPGQVREIKRRYCAEIQIV